MSFYDNEASWSTPARQASWDQQAPLTRTSTGPTSSLQGETHAFAAQFEEIDRATDNLVKSGKWLPGHMGPSSSTIMQPRRESVASVGRSYEQSSGGDARMGGGGSAGPSRQHSVSSAEHETGRPGSAGLQGYYAGQRFPGGRQSEAEQMLQAKRRMAAQRERELRNYHQEQQYNRSTSTSWSRQRVY